MSDLLKKYRIMTLNNPIKEETNGASWLVLPFIKGFDATRKANPVTHGLHEFPPGEYYLIPVKDLEDIDWSAEVLDNDDAEAMGALGTEYDPSDDSNTPF